MRKLTEIRREILMNVRQHKDLYYGFEGSQLGGAVRSMQMMRGVEALLVYDPKYAAWKLTDAGVKALETGEYR